MRGRPVSHAQYASHKETQINGVSPFNYKGDAMS